MTTRVVNKYKEPFDAYIGRPSKWGNPFDIEKIDKRFLDLERRLYNNIENIFLVN